MVKLYLESVFGAFLGPALLLGERAGVKCVTMRCQTKYSRYGENIQNIQDLESVQG